MTVIPDEFKSLVRDVVQDGKIDEDEKKALLEKAEELNVSPTDAQLYVSIELKNRKTELENNPSNNPKPQIDWSSILTTLSPVVVALIQILREGKK